MRGFDNKALILFPLESFYYEKGLNYRYHFQIAVHNILKYLDSIGMEAHAFLSDDLARSMPNLKVKFINTFTRGDLFFVTNNCDIPREAMNWDMVEFPDICSKIEQKDVLPKGLSTEERFDRVMARDKKAITSIIPTYRVVVYFYQRGSTRYRVVIKPNGGKIRLKIDLSNFNLTAYINNNEENPIDLLGVNYANKSLTNWEVV